MSFSLVSYYLLDTKKMLIVKDVDNGISSQLCINVPFLERIVFKLQALKLKYLPVSC